MMGRRVIGMLLALAMMALTAGCGGGDDFAQTYPLTDSERLISALSFKSTATILTESAPVEHVASSYARITTIGPNSLNLGGDFTLTFNGTPGVNGTPNAVVFIFPNTDKVLMVMGAFNVSEGTMQIRGHLDAIDELAGTSYVVRAALVVRQTDGTLVAGKYGDWGLTLVVP